MDGALGKMASSSEKMSRSVEAVRQRTRVLNSKLRSVTAMEAEEADLLLELETQIEED